MPFEKEHAARQQDPEKFEKFRRGDLSGAPKGIFAIFGINADGDSELQSIRAEAASMEVDAFRDWLKENEYKSEIEEATGEDLESDEDKSEDDEDKDDESDEQNLSMVWGAPIVVLASGQTSWVEVLKSGTFFSNAGPKPRRVEFSEEDVENMAQNWNLTESEKWFTGGAPVGYNHASAFGERAPDSTKAAARIRGVDVRKNDSGGLSLWALFEWTSEGADRIRSGEFAAVSAELLPPDVATSKLTGESLKSWVLIGATMTNTPFLPGLSVPQISDMVATSDVRFTYLTEASTKTEKRSMATANPLIAALAETIGVSESDLLAETQRLKTRADKTEALSEALATATSDLGKMRERNGELELRERERTLDVACSLGRCAPTEREKYWSAVTNLGEEHANELYYEGRLPVSQDSSPASPEADAADPGSQFLSIIDAKIASGLSEDAAWSAAKMELGGTLYPTTAES